MPACGERRWGVVHEIASGRRLIAVLTVLSVVVAVFASTASAQPNNSEQVVFSKTGAFDPSLGPLGFWVWCEADSGNPYAGACNGSIYLYAFGTPKHVSGFITEGAEGIYTMHLSSRDGSIACDLTNTAQATKGPSNSIWVSCTSPVSGTALATGAVVNVTGPS